MKHDQLGNIISGIVAALIIVSPISANEKNTTSNAETPEGSDHEKGQGESHKSWSYNQEKSNPDLWHTLGYKLCSGSLQSPINIASNNCEERKVKSEFSFKNYNKLPSKVMAHNNGHTIKVTMEFDDADAAPSVSGGELPGTYVFQQLHFHWGSEHTINGRRYPMEMHMVHINDKYKTVTEAATKLQGIAVLGIMFEVVAISGALLARGTEEANKANMDTADIEVGSLPSNPLIINMASKVKSLKEYNSTVSLIPVTLNSLLPVTVRAFYRYSGSLTTPTCNEGVVWTVFEVPLPIREREVSSFRNIRSDHGDLLKINYRPIQKTNGRTVLHTIVDVRSARFSTGSSVNIGCSTVFFMVITSLIT